MKLSDALKLYAVTNDGENQLERIQEALEGGASCIQYRAKNGCCKTLAREISCLCKEYKVPFLINDDVSLALECGADGVHVGQSDMNAREARRILGANAILGVSAATLKQALQAEQDGADYLGVGAVFPTSTKADAACVDYNTLRTICTSVSIPVVAIGGITEALLPKLSHSGIAGVAVVSALFSSENIYNAAKSLKQVLEDIDFQADISPGVILDFDGTLYDSLGVWETVTRDFLISLGKTPAPDLNDKLSGLSLHSGISYLKHEYNLEYTVEETEQLYTQMLRELYLGCNFKPGAAKMINSIKERKLLSCIATAGDPASVAEILKKEKFDGAFGPIYGVKEVGMDKSYPDFFLKILELQGASLKNTTVFEDDLIALKSAKAIGLGTVQILERAWNKAVSPFADVTLNSLEEWELK